MFVNFSGDRLSLRALIQWIRSNVFGDSITRLQAEMALLLRVPLHLTSVATAIAALSVLTVHHSEHSWHHRVNSGYIGTIPEERRNKWNGPEFLSAGGVRFA